MNWLNCFACKQKTINNVKMLDFSRTTISEVPPEVFHFERTLETLYLDGNKITELPRMLFQCEELRYLDISDNEIQSLPALISKLVNLHSLNASRNYLKHSDIPNNIHRCQKLTFLDLSSNTVNKLPEGITSLVNLKELYLNDTYIEFLPGNFGRLNNLHILELRDSSLSALPKSLRRLTSLVRLDISNNDFAEMPEVIGNMTNLKELWINGNRISSVILGIGNLQELQDFDASYNDIENVPKEISRCTKLNSLILSHNVIKELPHVIGNLKNLQILKLDYNCLITLPYSIGDLSKLEELDVQNNQLSSIPTSFGFLRKLNYFIASHNRLTSLPSEIGSCVSLTIINIHNNMLRKLPDEIGHLQNLTSIGLIGNLIEYLPIPIASLPNLRALWLSQNQSHPLIPLQTEKLDATGQLVLTCFLLPQIQPAADGSIDQDAQTTANDMFTSPTLPSPPPPPAAALLVNAVAKTRHIVFNEPGVSTPVGVGIREPPPAKLTRAPTPYPKDFQRFQRSLNNQLLRKNRTSLGETMGLQQQHQQDLENYQQLPNQHAINLNLTPDETQIKEAKVTPMSRTESSINDQKRHQETVYGKSSTYGTQTDFISPTTISDSLGSAQNYHQMNDSDTVDSGETARLLGVEMREKCTMVAPNVLKQPPPYHIAAAYSKNAKYFATNNGSKMNSVAGNEYEELKSLLRGSLLQQQNTNKIPTPPVGSQQSDMRYLDGLNNDRGNSYKHENETRIPKNMTVVLTPCCYVLGFTVIYNENGVFVNRVDENGNAHQKLYPGDKILMLDKIDLTKMEPWQAYKTVLVQGPETESFYISRH